LFGGVGTPAGKEIPLASQIRISNTPAFGSAAMELTRVDDEEYID
jgi:hypothetical protein